MNTDVSQTTAIPTFLVPTAMFTQPRFPVQGMLFDGSSLMYQHTSAVKTLQKQSECITSGEEGNTSTRTVPKGRRPKGMTAPQSLNLNSGAFPDRPMCRACGKFFMSRQQLNQHMLVHTDVRKYRCSYCERSFKQPSHLHQHHRIHTGEKPYKCPIPGCTRAFPQQSNLNHHLRNHDKPAPPPENTCTLCMRTYASETVLRSHITKIHLCNPDTLLGSQGNPRNIAKEKKPFIEEADDNLDNLPSLKRTKATYSGNNNIDSILYERKLTFPVKYDQSQFPYGVHQAANLSQQHNFPEPIHEDKYTIPNFANAKHEDRSVNGMPEGKSPTDDVTRGQSQNSDGFCDNMENDKELGVQGKYHYRYEYDSNGIDSVSHQGLASNVPVTNGNYDYHMGVSNDDNQGDSNESSNSNLNSSDAMSQHFEHSPPDYSSNTGRSRKRKAFQPQRIVQNKQPSDLDAASENR